MSDEAQAEFDELMRDKSRRTAHPEDEDDGDSEDGSRSPSGDEITDEKEKPRSMQQRGQRDEYRQYNDDYDDDEGDSDLYNDDDLFSGAYANITRDNVPSSRSAANTGPKGVIADAQHFRDSQRAHRLSSSIRPAGAVGRAAAAAAASAFRRSERILEGKIHGGTGQDGLDGPREDGNEKEKQDVDEDYGDDYEDGNDDDNDDEFMIQWRQKRLYELQLRARARTGLRQSQRHRFEDIQRSTAPYYHRTAAMPTVDGDGFLDAVDGADPHLTVVVYIYDDKSDVSTALESCVRVLAGSHPHVRFVRLHFHDASIDRAGVPALLAYRGGEMFASLVPLIDDIPDDAELGPEALESVLKRRQILV